MAKAIIGAVAGIFLGLIVGGAVTIAVPFGDSTFAHIYMRHAICLVIGAGFGSVTGAIIGSTNGILGAINRRVPSD